MKEKSIGLVSQNLAFNMNSVATTTLFTVPTGKEFTPFAICVSKISATLATFTATFGQSGAKTDFLPTQTLSNITTVGASVWLQPVPNATPAREQVTYTAGEAFVIDVTALDNATCDVSVFGFLNDA
ncbi:hypothetical protein LCGC14_1560510 [marine sediment metagenome]|uniref:Uncharacterized protein n=1 Tax=marine sediment metagenome TaxID=412755 RepID=A0A0F9IMP0_9ZZZZ